MLMMLVRFVVVCLVVVVVVGVFVGVCVDRVGDVVVFGVVVVVVVVDGVAVCLFHCFRETSRCMLRFVDLLGCIFVVVVVVDVVV